MNKDIGLLFPGQGSQYVGMGKDLYESYQSARAVYDRAEEILKLPIKQISFAGPEDQLRLTCYTQPAILVHSIAALSVLENLTPVMSAGHSLGEYSALYAAGALDFTTVLKLVKRRAELMFTEGQERPGMMAAIIGLDAVQVEQICQEVSGVVVPANYNEPKQTVISGEVIAVKTAMEKARIKGAVKVVALPVSGAFHSPLLEKSANEFAEYLNQFTIQPPKFPVVMNVSGKPAYSAEEIRLNLIRQLISPVRWVQVINSARELGCQTFLEVGPGKVLAGLVRRINPDLNVRPAGTVTELAALKAGG
uniref:Malonyl CoA-acyl carrier protein transacylase n=1 Tax=candidate division WOR-3 bacterium TaxID=2052148 RepID=A0A7V3PU27_UNCW3